MKGFFLVLTLLATSVSFADTKFSVKWKCSDQSVQVTYDNESNLTLDPAVLPGLAALSPADHEDCLKSFNLNLRVKMQFQKATKCLFKKSAFCQIPMSEHMDKIRDELKLASRASEVPPPAPVFYEPETKTQNPDQSPVLLTDESRALYQSAADRKLFLQNFLAQNVEYIKPADTTKGFVDPKSKFNSQREAVLADAKWLMAGIFDFKDLSKEEIDDVLFCSEVKDNFLATLLNRVNENKDVEDCKGVPLQVGQSRKFDNTDQRHHVRFNQVVKKLDDKTYEASLTLKFLDNGDSFSDLALKMHDRVKGCMNNVKDSLKGPNGEVLKFNLLTVSEASALPEGERPNPVEITIDPSNFRENSQRYRPDIPCETVVHEVLHLTGLVDEYSEDGLSTNDYGCRAVPKINTIMAINATAYQEAVGRTITCGCAHSMCKELWSSLDDEKKKAIAKSKMPCMAISALPTSDRIPEPDKDVTGLENNVVTFVDLGDKSKTLLAPSHFNSIVSGPCKQINGAYLKCASFAYKAAADTACEEKPKECSDESYFLGLTK